MIFLMKKEYILKNNVMNLIIELIRIGVNRISVTPERGIIFL